MEIRGKGLESHGGTSLTRNQPAPTGKQSP